MKQFVIVFIALLITGFPSLISAQVFDFDPSQHTEEELLQIIQDLEKEVKKAEKKSGKSSKAKKKTKKQLKMEALKNATSTTDISSTDIKTLEEKVLYIKKQIEALLKKMAK